MCVFARVPVCVCVPLCALVGLSGCVFAFAHACLCVCPCVCVFVRVFVCLVCVFVP